MQLAREVYYVHMYNVYLLVVHRYELYGRWKNRSYGVYPELMEAKTQSLSQGRYIMKLVDVHTL